MVFHSDFGCLEGGVCNSPRHLTYIFNPVPNRVHHSSRRACSIELPEMFLLTGGYDTQTKVSQYFNSGWMEDLPELNVGRYNHGCGFYFNDDMERVSISVLQRSFEDLRSFKDFCPKIHLCLYLQFIFRCRRIFKASKILGITHR